MTEADLLILGAGPAGLAAARTAADRGLCVCLLDEQPRAGGQIYRDVARVDARRAAILGADYGRGAALVQALDHPRITHLPGAVAWHLGGTELGYTREGRVGTLRGRRLLIATGALERPMPLPGWTLPGVMTAGAAQILLKGSGIVPERAVLVGSGPLLYLVAAQMLRAGSPPLALVETQGLGDLMAATRHLGGALRGWRGLVKGLGLLAELKRGGVPRYRGATGIAIEGSDRAEALRFTAGGRVHRVACDTVLLHHGVVPNVQASRALGLAHDWSAPQQCFVPRCDAWGRSALDRVFVAGDGAGIGGAGAAALAGRLAALEIATDLGALLPGDRDLAARPLWRRLSQERAIRPFLDRAYPPSAEALDPADDTLVCRCEEVRAGDIRAAARQGCLGPNQAKSFTRAGMGPCQGRYCGLSVTGLLSKAHGQSPQQTGYYRIRPPLKPVTLGELAGLAQPQDSKD